MTLSVDTVWEVRASASDNNGGGFVTGASGTDYTLQDAAQLTLTDFATSGVGVTTLTSATGGFTAAMVGNLIHLVSGTNLTAGFYEITAYTDTNTVTVDRAPDDAVGGVSAATGSVGGALADPATAIAEMDRGHICYVKKATLTSDYDQTTAIVLPVASFGSNNFNAHMSIRGYDTSRTTTEFGSGRPTIRWTAAVEGIDCSAANDYGWSVENLILDGTSTGLNGIKPPIKYGVYVNNCLIQDWTLWGVGPDAGATQQKCDRTEITGCGSGGVNMRGSLSEMFIHDNTGPGVSFKSSTANTISHSRITNNTGVSSDGVVADWGTRVEFCTIHANGRDGIRQPNSYYGIQMGYANNVITNNGGYGINQTSKISPMTAQKLGEHHHNAFRSNTSGPWNTAQLIAGPDSVTLTADPYTDAATDDYTPNNTSGGGALLRNASSVANMDIGALRHADPAGGGGGGGIKLAGKGGGLVG